MANSWVRRLTVPRLSLRWPWPSNVGSKQEKGWDVPSELFYAPKNLPGSCQSPLGWGAGSPLEASPTI